MINLNIIIGEIKLFNHLDGNDQMAGQWDRERDPLEYPVFLYLTLQSPQDNTSTSYTLYTYCTLSVTSRLSAITKLTKIVRKKRMIRTLANFPEHPPRLNDLESGWMKNFYSELDNGNLGRENLPSVMSLLRNGNIYRAQERIKVRQRRPYLYKPPKYSENISQHQQENSLFSLTNLFSSLWPEQDEAKSEDQTGAPSETKKTRLVKDARDPAVVFFPTNADSDCMDGSVGGGFNTFGFIAMMLATYNLVGLVSNNGNQNNNNQEQIFSRFCLRNSFNWG